MKRSLETSKMFGIKKIGLDSVASVANVDFAIKRNDKTIEKAMREAEGKKAEAVTILRRYASVQ